MTLPNFGPLRVRLLRKLKKNVHLENGVYEKNLPQRLPASKNLRPPKMYKDRGPNPTLPFRPIVSSIGTYNYNLAKYLCSLLQPQFRLITVPLTLLLLYRTSNLYLCLVCLWYGFFWC